jgi:hypothetical protein
MGSSLIEAQDYFMFALVLTPIFALIAMMVHSSRKQRETAEPALSTEPEMTSRSN